MAHAQLVECVPNFSEGQREDVIKAIASAIRETEGCSLLDVDAGASTNRTVYTFVGSPQKVVQAALTAARTARNLIDMTKHKGEQLYSVVSFTSGNDTKCYRNALTT